MRLLLGLALGIAAGVAGGYLGGEYLATRRDPCRGLCAEGTSCRDRHCVVADEPASDDQRSRRAQPRRRGRATVASGNDQSLRQPSRADLQPATEGPTLSATDVVDLTKGGGSGRELSSEQISALVRAQDPQIIACIDRARAGYAVAQGTVTVGFRIERSGRVEKVRLTGPALLVRAGLYRCVRPLIAGLRFPSSDRALVMTFPYRLR